MVKLIFTLLIGFSMVWATYGLGQWQTGRASEKQVLLAQQALALADTPVSPEGAVINLDNLSYRRIELQGQFDAKSLVYIDNRQVGSQPAVQVVQGFRPEGASYLIPVDRGLLLRDPANPRRAPDMPEVEQQTLSGVQGLMGTVLPRFAQSAELRGVLLGSPEDIHREQSNGFEVWSNFSLDAFAQLSGQQVSNYVVTLQPVVQTAEPEMLAQKVNGFYLQAVPLQQQVAKHKGYAFQWFTMSAVLLLLTLFFVYREFYKGKKR